MKPGDPKYRYLYALWAFLECLGFGGLIYGWGSLVYVLKDEGLYLDLCPEQLGNDTDTNFTTAASGNENYPSIVSCDERNSKFALVFTIGSSMFCIGSFLMGQINFKFGTRITRLTATALFILGSVLIAFTTNDVPWLLFPGLCCLAVGGITYLMTNTQISILFPAGGSIVIGLLCGGFDASSGIQLLIKIGYENGVTRQTSYIILACTHIMTLVSTFLFLPKDFVKMPSPKYSPNDDVADEENNVELVKGKSMNVEEEEPETPSLMSSIFSPYFLLHVLWLSILQLRFYFFLGSLNTVLEKLYTTKQEVSSSTNEFMYILICGLIVSPFAGFVYDGHKRFFRNHNSDLYSKLMPSVIPLAITTILSIIWSGLLLVEDPDVLHVVYVLVLFFRSFMYTLAAGFLSAFFPIQQFGILYGILLLCGGIICLFQYAFFSWAETAGFYQVNIALLALMFVSFIHPLYIWRQCLKVKRAANFN